MEKTNYIKATIDKVKDKFIAIASDESEDRHGEKIKLQGWELENYKKNPVLQWAHDYSVPPIGRANAIRISEGKLVFEPEFHEETQLAKEIKALFKKGILKAFSVGFIPKDMNTKQNSIEKAELLEISAVPVPANPNALVFAKEKGFKAIMPYLNTKKKDSTDKTFEADIEIMIEDEIVNENNKGQNQEQKKEGNDKIVKKALQKIARSVNFALSKIKENERKK